jgi:hypothetical protein
MQCLTLGELQKRSSHVDFKTFDAMNGLFATRSCDILPNGKCPNDNRAKVTKNVSLV